MSRRQTIAMIRQLEANGIIGRYAIGGGVASGRVDQHARSVADKVDALDALRDGAGLFRAARTARTERDPVREGAPSMRAQDRLRVPRSSPAEDRAIGLLVGFHR
jgi:hypothetical protein